MDRDLRFKVKFHALPLFRTHKVMLESDVRQIAKVEENTMDEPHARKIARVVLTKGEDKNRIKKIRCAKLSAHNINPRV